MTDANEEFTSFLKSFLEKTFCAYVESGEIEIDERPLSAILADYRQRIATVVDGELDPDELAPSLDYRESLLAKAAKESNDKAYEIAATLYATWLEHSINALLGRVAKS